MSIIILMLSKILRNLVFQKKRLLGAVITLLLSPSAFGGYLMVKTIPCAQSTLIPKSDCLAPVDEHDPHRDVLYKILQNYSWPTSLAHLHEPRNNSLTEEQQIHVALQNERLDSQYQFIWYPDTLEELHLASFYLEHRDHYLEASEPLTLKTFMEEDRKTQKALNAADGGSQPVLIESSNQMMVQIAQNQIVPKDLTPERLEGIQDKFRTQVRNGFLKVNELSKDGYFAANADFFHFLEKQLSSANKPSVLNSVQIKQAIESELPRKKIRAQLARRYSAGYATLLSGSRLLDVLPADQDSHQISFLDRALELEIDAHKKDQALLYRGTDGARLRESGEKPPLSSLAIDSTNRNLGLETGVLDQCDKLLFESPKLQKTPAQIAARKRFFIGLLNEGSNLGLRAEWTSEQELINLLAKRFSPSQINRLSSAVPLVGEHEILYLNKFQEYHAAQLRAQNQSPSNSPLSDAQVFRSPELVSFKEFKNWINFEKLSEVIRLSIQTNLRQYVNDKRKLQGVPPLNFSDPLDAIELPSEVYISKFLRDPQFVVAETFDPTRANWNQYASLSFGSSLLAGLIQDSAHEGRSGACALGFARSSRIGYAVRIPKNDFYQNKENSRSLFVIPPINASGRILGRGEYFHARTAVGIKGLHFDRPARVYGLAGGDNEQNTTAILRNRGYLIVPDQTPEQASEAISRYLANHAEIIGLESRPVKADFEDATRVIRNQKLLADYQSAHLTAREDAQKHRQGWDPVINQIEMNALGGTALRKVSIPQRRVEPDAEFKLSLSTPQSYYSSWNNFSDILKKEKPSIPIFEDTHVLSIVDIRPRTAAHGLVLPKPEVADLSSLFNRGKPDEIVGWLRGIAQTAESVGLDRSGYRIVSNQKGPKGNNAHQEVDHLHAHILGGECLGRSVVKQGAPSAYQAADADITHFDLQETKRLPLVAQKNIQLGDKSYSLKCFRPKHDPAQPSDLPKTLLSFVLEEKKSGQDVPAFTSFHDFAKNAPADVITEVFSFVRKAAADADIYSEGFRMIANHGDDAHAIAGGPLLFLAGGEPLGRTADNVFGSLEDFGQVDPDKKTITKTSDRYTPHLHCHDPLIQGFIQGKVNIHQIRQHLFDEERRIQGSSSSCTPLEPIFPEVLNIEEMIRKIQAEVSSSKK
jgi:histidine triad (HIT) family protein